MPISSVLGAAQIKANQLSGAHFHDASHHNDVVEDL